MGGDEWGGGEWGGDEWGGGEWGGDEWGGDEWGGVSNSLSLSHCSVLVGGGKLLGLWRAEGGADPLDSTHSSLHSRKSIILQVL